MGGYLDDRPGEGSAGARLAAAAAVGALVLFVAALLFANTEGGTLKRALGLESTPDSIAAEMEQVPGVSGFMREFRTAYPREHGDFVRRVSDVMNSQGRAAAEREAFHGIRSFFISKSGAIASAPDRDLVAIARVNLAAVQALSDTDRTLCAQYVMRGFAQGVRLQASVMDRLSELNRLQIRAARAGESALRVQRGPLSEEDYNAWIAAMAAEDARLTRMVEDGTIDRASSERQCDAGLILYRAAAELPAPVAARVNAHLIRNAAQMAMQVR